MRRTSRAFLTGLCALAVGSWLGLGRPSVSHARGMLVNAEKRLVAPTPPGPLPPSGPVVDFAPALAPPETEGPRLWPRDNPEASAKKAWLLAEGPYHRSGDEKRIVTLTFDDGPFPETTPHVLRLLAQYKVHATFFVLGRYLDGDDERAVDTRKVLEEIVKAGHSVGNHTHDHQLLTTLPRAQVIAQIDDGAASIRRVTGKEPLLFRPPFGQLDPWSMHLLRERNQELVLWNVEAEDMKNEDPKAMFKSIKGQLEYAGGGIVLLHDIRPTSVEVLSMLLDWLALHKWDEANPEKAGYEIVDLPSFIRATAESPQPYADRIALEHDRSAIHEDAAQHRKKRAHTLPLESLRTMGPLAPRDRRRAP